MFDAEDRSWWFRARRRIVAAVIGRLNLHTPLKIADLGCGTGGNLPMLTNFGAVVGVEANHAAAEFARGRTGAHIALARAEATNMPTDAFELVTMLDVLEHLDDERLALREVRRILKPGGHFVFTVPAFPFLWSHHDEMLHHRRRYRRQQLRRLLQEADFQIAWISYYNAWLFPIVACIRLIRRILNRDGGGADLGASLPSPINRCLEALFASERHLLGRLNLPFGVSLIGVARAPSHAVSSSCSPQAEAGP